MRKKSEKTKVKKQNIMSVISCKAIKGSSVSYSIVVKGTSDNKRCLRIYPLE